MSGHVCTRSIVRGISLVFMSSAILYVTIYRHMASNTIVPARLSDWSIYPPREDLHLIINELSQNITELFGKLNHLQQHFNQNQTTSYVKANSSDVKRTFTNESTSETDSLLTLFTTLKWDEDKEVTYNNTFINWASLKPTVNQVLFTDDPKAASVAMTFGWEVRNTTGMISNGLPVLKNMYQDAMTTYRSNYYCYANSDILFDDGLLKTLLNLKFHQISSSFQHVLVTGKRYNVVNVTKNDILKRHDIETVIKARGELFITSAEDYFITNRFYPWESVPDIVVASLAYDNWLVMNARGKRHLVVDATRTINVIHQSIDNNNHRSHGKDFAYYNANLLKEWSKINVPYHKGFVDCIERFTDIVDDVFVIRDRVVDAYCN